MSAKWITVIGLGLAFAFGIGSYLGTQQVQKAPLRGVSGSLESRSTGTTAFRGLPEKSIRATPEYGIPEIVSFNAEDVDEGKTAKVTLEVKNVGKTIDSFDATLDVPGGESPTTFPGTKDIEPGETETFVWGVKSGSVETDTEKTFEVTVKATGSGKTDEDTTTHTVSNVTKPPNPYGIPTIVSKSFPTAVDGQRNVVSVDVRNTGPTGDTFIGDLTFDDPKITIDEGPGRVYIDADSTKTLQWVVSKPPTAKEEYEVDWSVKVWARESDKSDSISGTQTWKGGAEKPPKGPRPRVPWLWIAIILIVVVVGGVLYWKREEIFG